MADLSQGYRVVVNKKHALAPDYAPGEDPTAQAAVMQVISTMQQQGYDVSNSYSGFRSYETQAWLYQSYVDRDGQAAADTYSARPGYSEHQTGLAYDLLNSSGALLGTGAGDQAAVNWLASHAHEYGFIVRYQAGKEGITGYMAEAWHLRYLGVADATAVYNSGQTLEEYLGVAGGGY
ncbi:MAG: M15 family metallopeptidase [Eubacteriales bacterium]|nr:M15 family metallopeptidase [Eubacteriales bacterium]